MSITFQINERLLRTIHEDLSRPHAFALERMGFISCRPTFDNKQNVIIVARTYRPIQDNHYIDDPSYGALMNGDAIRMALELSYNQNASIVHVHRHEHRGKPKLSRTDIMESNKFIPSFINVRPLLPHATIVLSYNAMAGRCWLPNKKSPVPINKFIITKASERLGVFV